MPEQVSPYDSGYRLEPRVHVNAGIVGEENPRPAEADDYGRVDFNNEFSETVLTVRVQRTEQGYIVRVDEHQDVALTIETSTQRQLRETAMQELDQALRPLAATEAVAFSDGEPDAFDPGHFILTPEREPYGSALQPDEIRAHSFVITELYDGTDESDPDRVPNRWEWEKKTLVAGYAGKPEIVVEAEGVIEPAEVDVLIGYATVWAKQRTAEAENAARVEATRRALSQQATSSMSRPGPTMSPGGPQM
ncbi:MULTISPECIES: hypothetical protein [unclassified Leucobacter]|uniref:hypothetical protein n=1 Tax=unclassified Leucobacter TaxID=2621730 RepID=UPI00301822AD